VVSTATISVPEISCAACKDAIEAALRPLDGVREAVVDIAARKVRIGFDESRIGRDQLVAAIEARGFDVVARTER
jgi:copper chaperone CopZ